MQSTSKVTIDVHLTGESAPLRMAREIREGLCSTPKRIPSKYFYDERGSRLFEEITRLPEYYLTDSEQALLERDSAKIAELTGFEELVELGAGSAEKTRCLIEAGRARGTLRRFLPFDVSQEIVEQTAREIASHFPGLEVHAVVGDFDHQMSEVPHGGRRLVALLGSTIGNFPGETAVDFLKMIATMLAPDDWLLLGTDLVKERQRLEAAYNDSRGVTAQFNLNVLNVVNQHLDGDFDPAAFEHVSFYNDREARIESYLRSKRDQSVCLEGIDLEVELERGEMIWTEVSCKFTRSSCERMLDQAGLHLDHWLTDDEEGFALSLSRPAAVVDR